MGFKKPNSKRSRSNSKKSSETKVSGLKLLSDEAITGQTGERIDGLGFQKYANVLSKAAIGTNGPFTIGVFGEWGTGKTSLLKLVQNELGNNSRVTTVWFNAWMYEKEEHPIVPLIATIIKGIKSNELFTSELLSGGKTLLRALRAVAYGFSTKSKIKIPGFAEIEASFVAKEMIDHESKLAQDPLLSKSLYYEAFEELGKVQLKENQRIVVIIDDLDRCFPDQAIKLLESIKLVLGQTGFIFIIGVARRVLEGYLDHRYRKEYGIEGIEGQKYLDKIVQLSFNIPPHNNRIQNLCKSLLIQLEEKDRLAIQPITPLIEISCERVPRDIVRFINNLVLDRAISEALSLPIPLKFFAITRGLQQRWEPVFIQLISSNDLCSIILNWDFKAKDYAENNDYDIVLKLIDGDHELEIFLNNLDVKEWLSQHNKRKDAIEFLKSTRDDLKSHARTRVYEVAKELGMPSKKLAEIGIEMGLDIRGHSSTITLNDAELLKDHCINNYRTMVSS